MEIALVNKIFKILPLNLWFLKFLNLLNSTKGNWFSDKIYWYGIWNSIRNWQERFKLTLALALLVMLSLALHCFSLVLLFSLMLLFEQWMNEWMNEWMKNKLSSTFTIHLLSTTFSLVDSFRSVRFHHLIILLSDSSWAFSDSFVIRALNQCIRFYIFYYKTEPFYIF